MGPAAARAKDPRSIERLVRWVTVVSSTFFRRLTRLVSVPVVCPLEPAPTGGPGLGQASERFLSVHKCGDTTSDNTCQGGQPGGPIQGAVVSVLGLRLCSPRSWVTSRAAHRRARPDSRRLR